ncbi:NYN domain-containing protein [Armatimonas rosea]|uniref:RNase NYN domain-containing protein n=1 Tax=Armatimonas rosea TaxID=685828 RepID=A0A7W9STQ3_ARMRO|nr:hypothetical protein [Armatimonas rosea]MBB6052133.1 hypothetical protein [Armatimonas rosea]
MTADEWREKLATLPTKEINRLLKSEPGLTAQISTGFRPGPETLKNPVVLRRLAEALPKNPKLAEALQSQEAPEPVEAKPKPLPPPTQAKAEPSVEPSEKLQTKLKEQRAALKAKEALLAEQALRLAQLEKERDAALTERDSERRAREAVEVRLERELRRKAPEPVAAVVVAPPTPPTPPPIVPPDDKAEWMPDALNRLLLRGHDASVLGLCRELLSDKDLPVAARAGVQGVYAMALGSLGATDAPEQFRVATEAYLSAGRVLDAAETLLRAFPRPKPSTAERALLQRLLALAERRGELEALGRSLARQRLTEPTGYRCLLTALETVGGRYPNLLPSPSVTKLSPDEPVALPTASKRAASVTARQLVKAIDEGEVVLITRVRAGLQELRGTNPPLADALHNAVGALSEPALTVLTAKRIRPIVVDASNVARHVADPMAAFMNAKKKPTGSAAQLLQVRDFLLRHGFFPVLLIADANLRHIVTEKARYDSLVERHIVRETLSGTSADELLLTEAHAHQAPLLTNDRLADWGKQAEGVERLGFTLHSGGVVLLPS